MLPSQTCYKHAANTKVTNFHQVLISALMDRGQRSTPPAVKCEPSVAAWHRGAPRTRPDPGSELWRSCRICCHSNQECSDRWAPRQPPGTGRRSGNPIGRRGWSAVRSLVEGSHRTAHWGRSRLDGISNRRTHYYQIFQNKNYIRAKQQRIRATAD